jgi:ElaB/YqjD/DUF883 family membrane-anchored ribosome-binding protein
MNEEILQNINHRIDEALDYSRQMVEDDEVIEKVEQLKNKVENYVREHPIQGLAFGLVSGYLIGKLLSSEDH